MHEGNEETDQEAKVERINGRFAPGVSGNPMGRVKGTANRITQQVREMIRQALENEGGVAYLQKCAREQPVAFLSLLGRLVPAEIRASLEVADIPTVVVRDYSGLSFAEKDMLDRMRAGSGRSIALPPGTTPGAPEGHLGAGTGRSVPPADPEPEKVLTLRITPLVPQQSEPWSEA